MVCRQPSEIPGGVGLRAPMTFVLLLGGVRACSVRRVTGNCAPMSNVFQRRHIAYTPSRSVVVEQRKAIRYAMAATAAFVWRDERGIQQTSEGVTRDMSGNGAFIYAAVGPTEQVPVRIEFALPPIEERKASLLVRVKGRVVRVERDPADPVHNGFAVSYESAVLRGGEEENADAQHR